MARNPKAAEVFPPGEFIRDELEVRGWSQRDLAQIIERPLQVVNQIINGKKSVTPQTAVELAAAFGTSPDVWLNLEITYQLAQVKPNPRIPKRAAAMGAR
jgi:HTH-type transcriptional regulator / antitoxin HigA